MAHSDAHRLLTFADLFCGIGGFHIATVAADETDARCAIRNAGYLARFTGKPPHAVVASVRMADGFQGVIASGGFHWVCLDKRDYD